MADTRVRFEIADEELLAKLRAMGDEVQREKALRRALRLAAAPIKKRALELVPRDSGELASSIRFRSRKFRGAIVGYVEAGSEKAFYAHIVEGGSDPHFQKQSTRFKTGGGQSRAKRVHPGTPAQAFLRPAFDENTTKAIRIFRDDLRERIGKIAKRRAPRGRHRKSGRA